MMSKTQKIWAWVFGAMVVVPEVLFWFTPLSIISFVNNFSKLTIKPIAYYVFSQQFFIDNPTYLFVALAIEWLGVFSLLILTIKLNKKLFIIFLIPALVWLSIIFALAYAISNMGW